MRGDLPDVPGLLAGVDLSVFEDGLVYWLGEIAPSGHLFPVVLTYVIFQGLFNGLSFWMLDHTVQGLTSSILSCLLLTIIFNTVDQQIIPRFIENRQIFGARERQSKTYSWPVFVAANMAVELTWKSLTAVPVFVSWYYPTGFWRNGLDESNGEFD